MRYVACAVLIQFILPDPRCGGVYNTAPKWPPVTLVADLRMIIAPAEARAMEATIKPERAPIESPRCVSRGVAVHRIDGRP